MILRAFLAVALSLAVCVGAFAFQNGMMMDGASSSSGGVACDFGPNTTLPTGTAGTDLTASGLTHCVLNADFTDNSGATVSGGWVMKTPSTWLAGCGTPAWGKFWLNWTLNLAATNGDNYSTGATPCNRASIIDDGTGTKVLNFQFALADYVSTTTTGIALYWPLCGNNSMCLTLAPALPNASYVELTYKLAAGLSQPNSDIIVSLDSSNLYDGDSISPAQAGSLDTVINEALANNASAAWNFDNYSSASPCSGTSNKCSFGWFKTGDLGNKHAYSNLSTTDASSTFSFCEYVDNSGLSGYTGTINVGGTTDGTYCTHIAGFTGANELTDRNRRTMIGIGNPLGRFTSTVSIYVYSIRIFSCLNYRTTNCSGPIVFH